MTIIIQRNEGFSTERKFTEFRSLTVRFSFVGVEVFFLYNRPKPSAKFRFATKASKISPVNVSRRFLTWETIILGVFFTSMLSYVYVVKTQEK